MEALQKKVWWDYLEEDLQELLEESYLLMETLRGMGADLPGGTKEFHDYSFIVFPAAKAYEGFLKKVFLDLKFISEDDYFGKRFRIGKALNPSLPVKMRNEGWVYSKVTKYCEGSELADEMWLTWKNSRNLVFHWFPNEKNALSFKDAQRRVDQIIATIDRTFRGCNL